MRRLFILLFAGISLFVASLAIATTGDMPTTFTAGKDYQVMPAKVNALHKKGSITVVEFFNYGCPACYRFEPALEKWLDKKPKDVTFERVPVVFHPEWQLFARAYYAAELLKLPASIDKKLFIAVQQQQITNEKDVATFFTAHGVKKEEFDNVWQFSPGIMGKLSQASELASAYEINEIPTIVVDGRYKVSAGMAQGSATRMLATVDYLIVLSKKQ